MLTLVGSLHPTTRRQLAELGDTGVPVLRTTGLARYDDPTGHLAALLRAHGAVAVATPEAGGTGGVPTPRHLRDLAALTAGCAEAVPGLGLVLTGGDTARAVCAALGATAIRATGTIAPGIPAGVLIGPRPLPIITKAGGFGSPTTLITTTTAALPPPNDLSPAEPVL